MEGREEERKGEERSVDELEGKAQTNVSENRYTSPKIDVFGRPFYQF